RRLNQVRSRLPEWVGCCMTYSRRLSRPALPGRSAASLAHCVLQFVRRLTTKELVFLRFVAPRSARVNDKNQEIDVKKALLLHFTRDRKWGRCWTSGFAISSVAISVEKAEALVNSRLCCRPGRALAKHKRFHW